MKKILALLKKDILLDKTNILMVIALAVGIPVFIGHLFSENGMGGGFGIISLLLSTMYCLYFGQNKISAIEYKYKGAAYLSLTPYGRKYLVFSKYIYFLCLFAVSVLLYAAIQICYTMIPKIDCTDVCVVWIFQVIFWGIYLPLEYKLGYNNIKNYFVVLFIAVPWGISFLNTSIIHKITGFTGNGLAIAFFAVAAAVFLLISGYISIKIYESKEL